jgi:uncharacterized RDD family membrane protein YckC
MKCKRCLTQVGDDVDTCPNCGQDLTSLRELLKNFYSEEPGESEDPDFQVSRAKSAAPTQRKEELPKIEPRIILGGGQSVSSPEFSVSEVISTTELLEGEEEALIRERSTKGEFWLRVMAIAVDHLILLFVVAIFAALGFLAVEMGTKGGRDIFLYQQARIVLPILLPLSTILSLTYFTFFHGAWGQTIGKMIFRLRVLRTDGQPLTFARALARTFAYLLSTIPFFLGFLWVAFSLGKRSWHDAIAGTMVVREQ